MDIKTDSGGNQYIETPAPNDEGIRVTFVPGEKSGYKVDSLRIVIRQASGRTLQGPEVPLEVVPAVIAAMVELVRRP